MPEGRRFADLKLLAMDMDSTLITIECIDELGDLAGQESRDRRDHRAGDARRDRVPREPAAPRSAACRAGRSRLARVYEERLRLTPGAETLIAACKKHGVKLLLVSGGFTFFTERLKARLGLDHTISNVLEVKGGKLTGALLGEIVDADAQGGEVPAGRRRRLSAPTRANRRHRRRRERPEDDDRGRDLGRLPRQAGGARAGELRAQLDRPRRRGEPVRVAQLATTGSSGRAPALDSRLQVHHAGKAGLRQDVPPPVGRARCRCRNKPRSTAPWRPRAWRDARARTSSGISIAPGRCVFGPSRTSITSAPASMSAIASAIDTSFALRTRVDGVAGARRDGEKHDERGEDQRQLRGSGEASSWFSP